MDEEHDDAEDEENQENEEGLDAVKLLFASYSFSRSQYPSQKEEAKQIDSLMVDSLMDKSYRYRYLVYP